MNQPVYILLPRVHCVVHTVSTRDYLVHVLTLRLSSTDVFRSYPVPRLPRVFVTRVDCPTDVFPGFPVTAISPVRS